MGAAKLKNNAVSILAGAINNSQTSFSLTTGGGAKFPSLTAGDWFPVVVVKTNGDFEIMKCTDLSGDTMTVDRGQESTLAIAFDSGSRVELRLTTAVLNRFYSPDNQGAGSGLDADTLRGAAPATTPTNDTIVKRDGSGGITVNDITGNNAVLAGDADVAGNAAVGGTLEVTGDTTLTGTLYAEDAINEALGADIASAATLNLDAATGNFVKVTGTTNITAITLSPGVERTVLFAGALTLTHGASLVLPGGANITTAANTIAVFRGGAAGVVYCVACSKVSGQGGRLVDVQVFKGSGWNGTTDTWNKPANLSTSAFLIVDACSAGGQGGGAAATSSQASAGSGGSSGPRFKVKIPASVVGATATVVTGNGGYGASAGSAGNQGGTTSFTSGGSTLSINGGTGGFVIAAGTTFAMSGYSGGYSPTYSLTFAGAVVLEGPVGDNRDTSAARAVRWSASQAMATQGAHSPFGSPGGMSADSATTASGYGAEYQAWGAGGGGSLNIGTKSAVVGGHGGPGYLVVYTYD